HGHSERACDSIEVLSAAGEDNMEEEAVFRVEGRFDGPAALRLRQRVMTEETPRTVLDFSHVEDLDDATLPLLTVNLVHLRRKGREVALRGLRDHQLR